MFSRQRRKRLPASKRGYFLLLALGLGLGLATLWAMGLWAASGPVWASSPQPLPGPPASNLAASYKFASRYVICCGETLTYTIRLVNTGAGEAVAQVTDRLPAEVNYLADSATHGGVYDEDTEALSWEAVSVPGGAHVSLSFAVTATEVITPAVITNTAVISADGHSWERRTWVLLFPEPDIPDQILAPSRKFASRHLVGPDERLSYTIQLRHFGTEEPVAQVTDHLPAEVSYVDGSATPGAVYDEQARTLSWSGVQVPSGEEVDLTFDVTTAEVTTPTLVTNTAVISAADGLVERRAFILLAPDRPRRHPILAGSRKSASQHVLPPDEVLTYTIGLHNSGTAQAVAQVTDRLPAQVTYIPGSARPGATYDAVGRTLSWEDIIVPVRGDVPLSFAVTTTGVATPTVVTNTAVITADGEVLKRPAEVLLVPERPEDDVVPPMLHGLTIDGQDALSSPTVTLHISATDNVGVDRMYVREWRWAATPWPHWRVVQSSGWIPYQADYPWTLAPESGTHFVGAWVTDGARHRSQIDARALDFASLMQAGATLPPLGVVPYLVYYDAGIDVTAVVSPTGGEADLYAWYTGALSEPLDAASDVISFTTESPGTYLFVVRGDPGVTYDLSVEPGGGPRAPAEGTAAPSVAESDWGTAVGIVGGGGTDRDRAEDLIAVLAESGLDPLDTAEAPGGLITVYLPMVVR